MLDIQKKISVLVKEQFPNFYKEEGQEFLQFAKLYYEFLEDENRVLYQGRRLDEYHDIDLTTDQFLLQFFKKYLQDIPVNVLGDKQLLIKHAVDFHRTKGTFESIRLLFRLLYNENIDFYLPKVDILRASDGTWTVDKYLEIEEQESNYLYEGELITGVSSGATAVVESYEITKVNNRRIHLLFLSNISGTFLQGELVTSDSVISDQAAHILGSPATLTVTDGGINHTIGDTFISGTVTNSGEGVVARVTEVVELQGIIEFTLVDGGFGYSNDAVVSITAGSNTTGSGAAFVISGFTNTGIYEYNDKIIEPYANVALDANNYSANGTDTSEFATANLSTLLANAIIYEDKTVGTIASIRTTNPGVNYDGSVTVTITDPYTSSAGIPDGSGGTWGTDAQVTGLASFGSGVVNQLQVVDTGYGFNQNFQSLTLKNQANTSETIVATIGLGGQGFSEGYWRTTDSFINSDKYIQDSFYYQEFSYQINSSRSLDKYIDVLRKVAHPTGTEPFGKVLIDSIGPDALELVSFTFESGFYNVWDDDSLWSDNSIWKEVGT